MPAFFKYSTVFNAVNQSYGWGTNSINFDFNLKIGNIKQAFLLNKTGRFINSGQKDLSIFLSLDKLHVIKMFKKVKLC